MGALMYGAGYVWAGRASFYLHDHELSDSPPDASFVDMLRQNCCLSGPHFPPPAIVEVLQDYVTHYYKVRRLHLIVVDLWRPWKYNTAQARWIQLRTTASHWTRIHCFAPWAYITFMMHLPLHHKFVCVAMLCPSMAFMITLLSDLHITREGVLRTGIGEHDHWHSRQIEIESLRRLSK